MDLFASDFGFRLASPSTSTTMTSFTSVIILELPSQIKPALLEQTIREETLPKLASQAGCLQTWWGTSRVLPRQLLVFIGPSSQRRVLSTHSDAISI